MSLIQQLASLRKEVLTEYHMDRQDLLDSIDNLICFCVVLIGLTVIRMLVTIFVDPSESTSLFRRVLVILIWFLICLISVILLKYKIRPIIKSKANKMKNLSIYWIIVRIIGTINILIGPFGIVVNIIKFIDDDFIRGSSLIIVFNLLYYGCKFFIRNTLYNIFIYIFFIIFIFINLYPSKKDVIEFFLKLVVASTIALISYQKSATELFRKSTKYFKKIIDKNDIYKFFF